MGSESRQKETSGPLNRVRSRKESRGLDADIADGLERLLDAGLEPQEVGVGLGLAGRLGDIDGPRQNLGVRDAEFDGLGDEREVLVSNRGKGLALFRGECRAGRQLALESREIALRGFQRGGIV